MGSLGGARGHCEAGAPGPKLMAWDGEPSSSPSTAQGGAFWTAPGFGERPSSSHLLCLPSEAALASGSAPSLCLLPSPTHARLPQFSALSVHTPSFFPFLCSPGGPGSDLPGRGSGCRDSGGLTHSRRPLLPWAFQHSVLGSDLPSGLEPWGLGFGGFLRPLLSA